MVKKKGSSADKILCACGCGKEVSGFNFKLKLPTRFKHGHNGNGRLNGNWKGGVTINPTGYRFIRMSDHPRTHSGYVLEHRLIMEKKLGRYLKSKEVIHHINGINNDNRPENLQLLSSQSEHLRLHMKKDLSDRYCSKCNSITTSIQKPRKLGYSSHPLWYFINGKLLCHKCYKSYRRKIKR